MHILIQFILSSAGLSWILTKSILFNSIRQWITRKHKSYKGFIPTIQQPTEEYLTGAPSHKKNPILKKIWWFIDEVMNCSGCMGFWAGVLFCPEYALLNFFQYGFIGAISSLILIRLSEFLRK